MRKPDEIMEYTLTVGEGKARGQWLSLLLLGLLAGAFIAFAAEGSNMAAFHLFSSSDTYGLGKVLAGTVFTTGLMLVLIAGGELFTGNILMIPGVFEKRFSFGRMLRNWGIVYVGNFIGSILIAYMIVHSGQLHSGGDLLGAITLKIAVGKVNLSPLQAFYLGLMCNWLVCLAVWLSYAGKTVTDRILGIFFPIWLFIISGFEHSVANMYYIPAGILVKSNAEILALSGLGEEALENLTWLGFLWHNLLPVTLGNLIGGGLFVATIYWYIYRGKKTKRI